MVMHLNDLYVFRPIFANGALLCFAWAFIHCTDVGGYAPGSIDMQNGEVFQEGLRLRPVKLFKAGQINQEVWDIFADNCRIPALNWGDLTACLAALAKAEQRMQRLFGNGSPELIRVRQMYSILRDESSQRLAVAERIERSSSECEMDVRGSFIPRSELPFLHIHLHAFRGSAKPGVLPIVDRARAIRREVRQPAIRHEPLDDQGRAIAQEVSAVN